MGVLNGKVALVTGAGQGVGRGIALALASEGAAIAVTGRTLNKIRETCQEIEKAGGRAYPIVCEVTSLSQIESTVSDAVKTFGGLNILVNNAYDGAFGPLLETSDDGFMKGLMSGPVATFRFMKVCHPHLKIGGGDIVNLASGASQRWDASNYGAYAVAKQGVRALTRAGACIRGRDGIRVNTITPLADSPALDVWTATRPDEARQFFQTIPLGRIGSCERDIGRAVVALVGPDLRYLTGATIPLDGGQAFFG